MQTKAVVFDKDGTLLDFEALWIPVAVAATKKVLSDLEITDVPCQEILTAMGVTGGVATINGSLCYGTYTDIAEDTDRVLQKYGYTFPIADLAKRLSAAYFDCMSSGEIKPTCPELPQILKNLKDTGIIVVLVTSDGPELTQKCLEKLGILEYFDILYTDDGTHPPKPDPYCIHHLLQTHGLTKAEVVMVGDTLTDMQFAKNAGVRGIGLAQSAENEAILRSTTDTVLCDLTHLQTVL